MCFLSWSRPCLKVLECRCCTKAENVFVFNKMQTHRPGSIASIFRAKCYTTQLSRHTKIKQVSRFGGLPAGRFSWKTCDWMILRFQVLGITSTLAAILSKSWKVKTIPLDILWGNSLKAHSLSPQRSADSAVDCISA